MKLQRYFEDPKTTRVNTLDDHAYFIPYPSKENALEKNREESDRLKFLNGNWKFKYFDSLFDVTEDFFEENFCANNFDTLAVPSVWQMNGYNAHQYTNTRYPFPYDPPFIPKKNPCGAYIRDFELTAKEMNFQKHLIFEGVDSCYYVWVNGKFVGYNEVSHSCGEFDISKFVKEGRNRLAVLVFKWCSGSYLEDQDKLRMSGIFRDVYIMFRPENHIVDYTVSTKLSKDYESADITAEFKFSGENLHINYELLDVCGKTVTKGSEESGKIMLNVSSPALWNAENPQLYTLIISCGGEVIAEKIGIRKIEIKDGVFYINGVNVKFKGVNRHDSDPVKGYAVDRNDVLRDLLMMKKFNINGVRTSHYPNAPYLVQLCDEIGLYVIAESDFESHGCSSIYKSSEDTMSMIAADRQFEYAILDRVERNVKRDKNRPCVISWSLGNESGYGINIINAAKWIKSYDTSRPIHYEGITHAPKDVKLDDSVLDVYSRMYPKTQDIDAYFTDGKVKKPYILCEFCHAMGNGIGDLEDYFERIYKYDGMCGGFIWEWCDHAVFAGREINGKKRYLYGGDFNDYPNDGNFCMDGLVNPDRTPHVALFEYKNVIRPARIKEASPKSGRFTIKNTLDFTDLADYLNVHYTIKEAGTALESGEIKLKSVKPHKEAEFNIKSDIFNKKNHDEITIKFDYILKNDCVYSKKGLLLGFDQFVYESEIKENKVCEKGNEITLGENERYFVLSSPLFKYVFNRETGNFDSLIYKNENFTEKAIRYNIFRAPTDNDMNISCEWQKAGYDIAESFVYDSLAKKEADYFEISCYFSLAAVYRQPVLKAKAIFKVFNSGIIEVSISAIKDPIMPYLPRFGVRVFMPKRFENVTYRGYGPYESYADKHRASYKDTFSTTVTDSHVDYSKPQENGSHWGCDSLTVSSNEGFGLNIDGKGFCFNTSHFTQEELAAKAHNFELNESGYTVLCVDYLQSGIGSNSCGPDLLEKYRIKDSFEFNFSVAPFKK